VRFLRSPRLPFLIAVLNAAAFLAIRPGVGDLWAALARQDAARAGVGPGYWFAWFSGGSTPGAYSLLSPPVSAMIGAPLLGAIATVLVTPLVARVVAQTRSPELAVWIATLLTGLNLWAGRVPFAAGLACAAAALVALRSRRLVLTAMFAVLCGLFSPLAGVFLVLGLAAIALDPTTRSAAMVGGLSTLACLGATTAIFGSAGPEGFTTSAIIESLAVLLAFLIARPSRPVTLIIVLAAAMCALSAEVATPLGSNAIRLIYTALPVAVVATARARRRLAVLATLPALVWGTVSTGQELAIAAAPPSSVSYYRPAITELSSLHNLAQYRVEVVPDGTHTAAYALVDLVAQAGGYETQADNKFDSVAHSDQPIDSTTFRQWLDDNAVGYVLLDRHPLKSTPEAKFVLEDPNYLTPIWQSHNWLLYAVRSPTPIVARTARITDSDQAELRFSASRAGNLLVRVHWSNLLTIRGSSHAAIHRSPDGWIIATLSAPGKFVLRSRT
jgi:hypothetical protein